MFMNAMISTPSLTEMAESKGTEKNGEDIKPPTTNLIPFSKLLSYADGVDWILMVMGTVGSIIHGMAQPIGYLLLGKALNAFGNNINDRDAMVKALYKVVPFVWYMAIATLPAGILEIGCWMYTSERQLARMKLAYLKAVLSQEIGAFDTDLTCGKIIAGITNHMNLIQDAIGEKLGHFLSSFSTFAVGILVAFVCCWEVGLLTLLVVPMILVTGATYSNKMNAISGMRLIYLSEATSMVEQTISQIKTVFSFVGESSALKSFSNCMEKQFQLSKKEALIKGVGLGVFQTITFCSWALIVWVGAVVVTAERAKGGDTIAAVMSILFGAISVTYAAPDLQIFNQAKVAGSEVFQVIERESSISYETKGKELETISGNIDIRGVYFSYPSRNDKVILRGFSLSIPAGKVVALVGSSGCGKSTVISLMQRFYDPSTGEIFIDNHNIKDIDLKFLRKNVGAVSQEPSLFAGTIKDNLKVGNMDASDQLIEKAAMTANAQCFISQLPNQYTTEVGERGVQLSGGQKQRIAIARAILKDPPILLLDEATSALDSESEKLVQDALEKAMKGRTVILIAHRLSTVINADMIAVVENGKVAETGSHRELLKTSEFYHSLFNMQNLTTGTESRGMDPSEEVMNKNEVMNKSYETSSQASELSEQSKEFSIELHVYPVQGQVMKRKTVPFSRIWFGLDKIEIAKSAFGSFAAALSGISKPVFGFFIITIGVAYYKEGARGKVGMYSMVFCLIGMLALVTHTLQHYFYGVVGEKAMRNLRQALYSAVLRNEIAWFEKPENGVGFLTSRIINDTTMIKTIISDRMAIIVQCISSILIATTVSMIVNWRMGLVAWAVMPCHFIGGLVQAKSARGFAGDSSVAHQDLVALASESTTNIRTVASFAHEEQILKKAKLSLKKPMRMKRKQCLKYGIVQGLSLCLWNIAHAIALWYTTILVHKNQASFEDGIRSYQIFSLTVPSITELWTLIPTVISAISVLTPAFETLDRQTEIEPDTPENSKIGRMKGKVVFEKVSFNYPSRPEVTVLSNFTLSIEAGLKVALVGPSGAGKSSVLALLLRFYDPCKGRILIDRKDIKSFNLRWLRTQIGFVQQEPLLFSSSIRDNICYGNEETSETEMVAVAMDANIHEFISNLPDGYNTVVGEKGCQLSGGQKQRIAIARTLLKKPAILLLDEATSALDAESERAVMNALELMKLKESKGLLSRCTQITVAHRLSTVVNSDTIVVMDKGEVAEMGPHSDLIAATEGIYSRLLHLQSLVESKADTL
ncbi:ABC transporter B family member 10-like [Magnolia sinica]|uniref:ABC transporter B family member 10-like n=1 Tax=Magnolia sinica TaxID=86752 RepID=UPI00265ADEC8|nr:ABC transporter B family member 10-like [Magnolia sinica]